MILETELDRLREFASEVQRIDNTMYHGKEFCSAVGKALTKLDARATGGEGT